MKNYIPLTSSGLYIKRHSCPTSEASEGTKKYEDEEVSNDMTSVLSSMKICSWFKNYEGRQEDRLTLTHRLDIISLPCKRSE